MALWFVPIIILIDYRNLFMIKLPPSPAELFLTSLMRAESLSEPAALFPLFGIMFFLPAREASTFRLFAAPECHFLLNWKCANFPCA